MRSFRVGNIRSTANLEGERTDFEPTCLRAIVPALAMLLTTALLIEVAQPAGADAAAKKTKKRRDQSRVRLAGSSHAAEEAPLPPTEN